MLNNIILIKMVAINALTNCGTLFIEFCHLKNVEKRSFAQTYVFMTSQVQYNLTIWSQIDKCYR